MNIGLMLGVPEMMTLDVTSSQNDRRREIQNCIARTNKRNKEAITEAITSGDFSSLADDEDLRTARSLIKDSITAFKQHFDGHVLRRTPSSHKRDGCKIVDLPHLNMVTAWIKLGKEHEDALMEATEIETAK
jgi:hypothetical protein